MPDITLEVPGHSTIPAYYAPAQGVDGPAPGVVVVHEAFGLTDAIREITDQFATRGYHALAPDLVSYASNLRCLVHVARALSSGEGRSFDELEAARTWLAGHEGSNGRVGVAGFCLGGAFAMLLATRGFEASAAMYGQLPKNLDRAFGGACPVVASYGGRDSSLRGAGEKLEAALEAQGVRHDVKTYPEAGHSFMTHSEGDAPVWIRPMSKALLHVGYVDTAAHDSWQRIDAMFSEALR
ncbi:MAG: dienelactone hydrolase family protein [Actinobacteria bacterium]|nr:dienelactone hydrolase family protein [Actinomycetota bacterium]